MTAPTKQQMKDPTWWDRNAPDDAQQVWLVWDGPSAFAPLIRVAWAKLGEGIICGEQQSAKVYQRPTKPAEWDGEGLPPVGCECEIKWDDGRESWHHGTVLCSHSRDKGVMAVVLHHYPHEDRLVWAEKFRPLRTAEQRQRKQLVAGIARAPVDPHGYAVMVHPEMLADALIADGWRKGDE